jgi:hypothetical protein
MHPGGHYPLGPRRTRSQAQRSLRRTIKTIWDCGWRGTVRRSEQLDPEGSPPRPPRANAIEPYSRATLRGLRVKHPAREGYFTTSTQSFSFVMSAVLPSLSNAIPCGVPPRSRDVTTVNEPRDTIVSVPNDDER